MAAQVSREEIQRRGRYSLTIAALFVLILLGGGLPLPQRAILLLPIGVAIVVSAQEMRRLARTAASGFTRLGPIMALGLSSMLLVFATLQVLVYVPLKQYQDCLSGANTNAAAAACNARNPVSVLGSVSEL